MSHVFSSSEDDLFKKFKLKHHRYQHTSAASYQCVVCDDRASGVDYGSRTCEECRGFFQRTIETRRRYRCRCVLNKLQRYACQSCRFRKCLARGMRIEAARFDQIRTNSFEELNYLFEDKSFDQLFHHLRILMESNRILTEELIKKIAWLVIETFINWYRKLPFYPNYNESFHQLILKNQWASFTTLILCHFIKRTKPDVSYDKIRQHTTNLFSKQILEEFLQFFSQFTQVDMTKTELILLTIILILQSGRLNHKTTAVISIFLLDQAETQTLQEIYFKLIYTYETHTFPHEKASRYTCLINLSRQIHQITKLLFQYQHFSLPFLLLTD